MHAQRTDLDIVAPNSSWKDRAVKLLALPLLCFWLQACLPYVLFCIPSVLATSARGAKYEHTPFS